MATWDQVHLNTGQKASAALHAGLILWVIFFDLFEAPDEPMIPEVTEVSIISSAEFEALSQPAPPPAPAPTPAPAPARDPAPISAPPPVARPQPVTPPEPIRPPEPVAQPTPEPPQAAVVAPIVTPDAALTPVQPRADRVAPEAAPAPAPDVTIAPQDRAAATPDATATVDAPEEREAAQRDAAATETVTEATRISETEPARRTATAPEVSLRPARRPTRAAPAPDPQPTAARPTPLPADTPAEEPAGPSASAIEDALAAALAESEAPAISQADVDALRLSIESCWNVGLMSQEALGVVVTIAFELTPASRPLPDTIRLVDAQGGSLAAQQVAFDAGRQAIVQCGINGYGLPQDLYDQWRLVEITFNPARMLTR